MKIGSNDVASVKLGNQDVQRIYQGSNVAWEPSGTTPPSIYDYEYLQAEYWVQGSYMFAGTEDSSNTTIDGVGAFTYNPGDNNKYFSIRSGVAGPLKIDVSFTVTFPDGDPVDSILEIGTANTISGGGWANISDITTGGDYSFTGVPGDIFISFRYKSAQGTAPAAYERAVVTNMSLRLSLDQDFTWSDTPETVGVTQTIYNCDSEVVTIDGGHVTVEIPAGSLSGTGIHVINYPSNNYGIGIRTVELNADLPDFDPTVNPLWMGAYDGCMLPLKTGRKMAMVYDVETDGSDAQRNDKYYYDDLVVDYNYEWFPATS